ncbi:unnamed protein product [Coregonus sp. 'balchen']|nr:unnamed protein product [Coregonus sp. 'balchen']
MASSASCASSTALASSPTWPLALRSRTAFSPLKNIPCWGMGSQMEMRNATLRIPREMALRTDTEELISEIRKSEPLITASRVDQVKLLIVRLQEKLGQQDNRRFYLFKALQAHILPLTNVAFNKSGSRDKIATGSFDKTCRLWSAETGKCFHTFRGHTAEIGHSAEIISLSFNTVGDQLVTGSFDHTVSLWDVPSGRRVHTLRGHRGEISSVQFNWDCSLIITGSMDKSCTARVYSAASYQCISRLEGHEGEISKICFNPQGSRVLTASADKTARLQQRQHLSHLALTRPMVSRVCEEGKAICPSPNKKMPCLKMPFLEVITDPTYVTSNLLVVVE